MAVNFPFVAVKTYLDANAYKSLVQLENNKKASAPRSGAEVKKPALRAGFLAGVYLWYNSLNFNYYVGSSNNLWDRFRNYYSDEYLNRQETKNLHIISASPGDAGLYLIVAGPYLAGAFGARRGFKKIWS